MQKISRPIVTKSFALRPPQLPPFDVIFVLTLVNPPHISRPNPQMSPYRGVFFSIYFQYMLRFTPHLHHGNFIHNSTTSSTNLQ